MQQEFSVVVRGSELYIDDGRLDLETPTAKREPMVLVCSHQSIYLSINRYRIRSWIDI